MTTSGQMNDSYMRESMEMEFSLMAPTSVFSPPDLKDYAFQGVTHGYIHGEVKFMSGHGEICSLKEEVDYFPYECHFYSLVQ